MLTQAPKGTKDVLPSESGKWQYIENKARDICARFGYREIRTPVFEHTELFLRGVGDTTDIVQKEMYTLHGQRRPLHYAQTGGYGGHRAHVRGEQPLRRNAAHQGLLLEQPRLSL